MKTDPDRILAELASTQHGVFTRREARGAGLTNNQIHDRIERHWIRLHDGVFRFAAAPPTWRGDLLAATKAAGTGAAISHRSAAALYDLPGGCDDLVELTTRRWDRTIQSGLVVHESTRLTPEDIAELNGIPVVRAERLLLDLASIRPFPDFLERVIHAARRHRLITYESTHIVFDRHARRGLKGVVALRAALETWNPEDRATESDMETLLLQAVRDHGLPDPVVQCEVRDALGNLVGRADAAYPGHKIAIEYDSMQEHSDEFQLARDARRRNALQTAGYVVLSVRRSSLISGGGEVCSQIATIMRRTA